MNGQDKWHTAESGSADLLDVFGRRKICGVASSVEQVFLLVLVCNF